MATDRFSSSREVRQSRSLGEALGNVLEEDRMLYWICLVLVLGWAMQGTVLLGDEPAGRVSVFRETLIRVTTEKVGTATHVSVENVQAAEVTVTIEMDLVNLRSNVAFPYTTTLPGKSHLELFSLTPIDEDCGWSWTYTYYSTFGGTAVVHDNAVVYSLPYAPGERYRVSQGNNGEYSHFGPDQYAIDWRMPMGTAIHAARAGIVVGIKNDSDLGGDDPKFDWDANYVLIQHADGTLGQYVHLLKGGSQLDVGQRVELGQFIGRSGNTGHSTGPHLHFSVFKARDGKHRETLPVRFRTAEGIANALEEGRSYQAPSSAVLVAGSSSQRAVSAGTEGPVADGVGGHGGSTVGH